MHKNSWKKYFETRPDDEIQNYIRIYSEYEARGWTDYRYMVILNTAREVLDRRLRIRDRKSRLSANKAKKRNHKQSGTYNSKR